MTEKESASESETLKDRGDHYFDHMMDAAGAGMTIYDAFMRGFQIGWSDVTFLLSGTNKPSKKGLN